MGVTRVTLGSVSWDYCVSSLVRLTGWTSFCHAHAEPVSEGKRFGSVEHIACAAQVGLASSKDGGKALIISGIQAGFNHETLLPVGSKGLTFGEIVCLGGDYYAHFDAASAADMITARFDYSFSWASLIVMVVVILGYFLLMMRFSESEYREVIAEKFGEK